MRASQRRTHAISALSSSVVRRCRRRPSPELVEAAWMPRLAWRYESSHAKSGRLADACPRANNIFLLPSALLPAWSFSPPSLSFPASHLSPFCPLPLSPPHFHSRAWAIVLLVEIMTNSIPHQDLFRAGFSRHHQLTKPYGRPPYGTWKHILNLVTRTPQTMSLQSNIKFSGLLCMWKKSDSWIWT